MKQTERRLLALMRRMFLSMRPPSIEGNALMELTMPQLRMLLVIHAQHPLRMSDISERVGVGLPTVTSLVGKLEDKGLVAREHDEKDRRIVLCSTTDAGRTEVERLWQGRMEYADRIHKHLTDAELEVVAQGMELLVRAIEKSHQSEDDSAKDEII